MKNISLYINQGSSLNKMHPYTKLLYILTAIMIPLTGGKLWLFPVMIVSSLVLLASGKILKRALPLVAFSFTLIVVIFLIQGLFNYNNETVLFSVGVITFYKEGMLFATRIGCNILNMLLSFGIFVLTTSPQELADELEKSGFSPRFGYVINSVFQILPQMMATKDTITDAQRSRGMETRRQSAGKNQSISAADFTGSDELTDQHKSGPLRWTCVASEESRKRPGCMTGRNTNGIR